MIQAIADLPKVRPTEILAAVLGQEIISLDDIVGILPTGLSNPKLTALVLIAAEYSYFDGAYRRRKFFSASSGEPYTAVSEVKAYERVKLFIGEYLSKL